MKKLKLNDNIKQNIDYYCGMDKHYKYKDGLNIFKNPKADDAVLSIHTQVNKTNGDFLYTRELSHTSDPWKDKPKHFQTPYHLYLIAKELDEMYKDQGILFSCCIQHCIRCKKSRLDSGRISLNLSFNVNEAGHYLTYLINKGGSGK